MNLYTIYDTVAKECGPVFEAKNDGTATRSYLSMLKSQNLRSDEYLMYSIGRFDHESMELFIHDKELVNVAELNNGI